MTAGRPTKYRPKYCKALIEHMAKGYSYECFCATIGVAFSTTQLWEKHEEFSVAKKKAFAASRLFWEGKGVENLHNPHKGDSFNQTVWIFNMKNRFGWGDRSETKVQLTLSEELKGLADKLPD